MWPFSSSYPEVSCRELANEYDYIVLGGGTAGCALANRLSSNPDVSVLLVERGMTSDTWVSRVPLFSCDFASNGSRTFRRESTPQTFLGERRLEIFNGKVLGGSSRINSMLYTRGTAAEYNAWNADGREGWSFDDVLPLFKRSEYSLDTHKGNERDKQGEWMTRMHTNDYFSTTPRVLKAANELGFPFIEDINSSTGSVLGCAKHQFTIDDKGYRHSAFAAFLPLELVRARRSNLTICIGTIAAKLDIKPCSSNFTQANGVFLRSTTRPGNTKYVSVKREVILCSGPLGNPQILMLSGIGPREHLETLGIPVLKHLPGVGAHLQDHLAVPIVYHVPIEDSLVIIESRPLVFIREFFKYLFCGTGLLLSPVAESVIFAKDEHLDSESKLRADKSQLDAHNLANIPNIEIMPIAYDATGIPFDKSTGSFSFMSVLLRPRSKGTIRLSSSDPNDPIECDLNALSDPRDWEVLKVSLRLSMRLAEAMKGDGYSMIDSRVPKSTSDADLDAFIKQWARTTYHYSSSCRMAPEDDKSPGVVDDKLRVYGVHKLRIADSSIFPQIISAHLQAPTIMVAEKCADLLKSSNN